MLILRSTAVVTKIAQMCKGETKKSSMILSPLNRHFGTSEHRCTFLPDERSKKNMTDQGWDIDTIVKKSLIPGAGFGR